MKHILLVLPCRCCRLNLVSSCGCAATILERAISPTTSPYLTLTNRNGSSNGFAAYQNYVVPQIQQQQFNAQQQQQLQHLQQQQQKSLTGWYWSGGNAVSRRKSAAPVT